MSYQLCYSPLFGNFSDHILHLVGFRCLRGGSAQVVVRSTNCANAPFGKLPYRNFHLPAFALILIFRTSRNAVSYQLCYSPLFGSFSDHILRLVGFRCFRGGSAQCVARSTNCANAPPGLPVRCRNCLRSPERFIILSLIRRKCKG